MCVRTCVFAGGITVTIRGSSLDALSGAPTVTVGMGACVVMAFTHSAVECTLQEGEGLSREVALQGGGGRFAPVNLAFDYDPPAILGVVFTVSEMLTQGGATLRLDGENFGLTPMVLIGRRGWGGVQI